MDRVTLQDLMRDSYWNKDRCVSFAIDCARSLIAHAPDDLVLSSLEELEQFIASGYPASDRRRIDKMVQPISALRTVNQGLAREVCHATLHAFETALSAAASSAYGQSARAWAAVAAADATLGSELLSSEGLGE